MTKPLESVSSKRNVGEWTTCDENQGPHGMEWGRGWVVSVLLQIVPQPRQDQILADLTNIPNRRARGPDSTLCLLAKGPVDSKLDFGERGWWPGSCQWQKHGHKQVELRYIQYFRGTLNRSW